MTICQIFDEKFRFSMCENSEKEPVCECHERCSTMMTGNLDFSEWGEPFPNSIMGAATTIDRLRHGARRVILEGESYRSPKPLPDEVKRRLAKGAEKRYIDTLSETQKWPL